MGRKLTIAGLKNKITQEMEDRYFDNFSKQSCYYGNNIYGVGGTNLKSTDTRELFLMYCATQEGIEFVID